MDYKVSENFRETLTADLENKHLGYGVKLGGKLKDTIALLNGDEKLYLRASKPMLVKDVPLKRLSGIELLPDAEVFKGEYEALVSLDDPAGGAPAEPGKYRPGLHLQ